MSTNTQFVAVNFSEGQLLDEDTMDQLNDNSVYLRNQMVDGKYTFDWGGIYDSNLKLMCGRIYIPTQTVDQVYGTVAFPAMFEIGCQPVITTGILASAETKFDLGVYGIGTYFPDHRGFQFKIKVNPAYSDKTFNTPIYLMYQAMGY